MSFPFHPQALLLCPHSILYLPASPPITPSPYYCQTSILKLSDTRKEIFETGGNEERTFSMLPFHWNAPDVVSSQTSVYTASITETSPSLHLPSDTMDYKTRPQNPIQFSKSTAPSFKLSRQFQLIVLSFFSSTLMVCIIPFHCTFST